MVKKKKDINKGKKDNENNKRSSAMSSEFLLTPEPDANERIIRVIVNSIENIVKRDPVNVTILVYHDDNLLGESQSIRIQPDFREPPTCYSIDYHTKLPIITNKRSEIDAVVSTPLLIQVTECQDNDGEVEPVSSGAGDSKKKDKTKGGRKSAESKEKKIMGLCNLDILPIILGEKIVTERLVVEVSNQSSMTRESSWMNLPILTVTLTQDENDFFPSNLQVNYLSVTVESIYNPPISFTESLEYKAATVVFIDGEDTETVLFDRGKFSKYRDLEKTKRWRTLSGKCEGRAGLSKYKIECDYENTKNQLEYDIDFKKILEEDVHRIEWNCMSRHLMLSSEQQAMKDNINKYKYWPFQFMISSNVSEVGKTKSKDTRPQLYQCYADVSELLYPGRTQIRIITQLHTYNTPEMMEKTGLERVLFNNLMANEPKQKEKKGNNSAKGNSSQLNIALVDLEVESSYPLTNESGEPVFVVLQFQLQEPLVASRTMEEVIEELHEFLGPTDQLPPYPYTGNLAEEQYTQCIRKLVETISESYRDFNEESNATDCRSRDSSASHRRYPYISDEVEQFIQYLYDTGKYVAIQTTLKNKIILLLDQKFKMKTCMRDSEECQNFVATAYLYLVEQMHVALNSEAQDQDNEKMNPEDAEDLCYYAEENYELGNIAEAKNNYMNLIKTRRKDPNAWLKYAIFLKKFGDKERALECCREAIKLDSRNKIALLLHGAILTEKEHFKAAEIFLKATTELYPLFAEGWAVLHLFYHRTEYFQGADMTIRVAGECLKNEDRDTSDMECLIKEPLAWSTIHCLKDRVYLMMAVFLLKLNLFDFAGIALAKELSLMGRSTPWLYYMAVHHYLLGRYDDALTHLKEAQLQHGMDYSISGLMGHCYLQKGNTEPAIECYEYARTLFNRPADIHLIDLKLGNYCLDVEEYERAKKIFISVCKTSPTAFSWLGLGVACYHTANLKDAEIAFTEANRLDHKNPEVWAYLCLLNMTLHRYDEFAECYRRMIKSDLQKAKLWLLVEKTMESLGLSSPMLLSATSENTE